MVLKIIWSAFAETQLNEIYTYYEKKASPRIARKIVRGIINEPKKLIKTPHIGQEEELLKQRKNQYRYLVFKNYKLIYSVDVENGFIKIADVFDTRQYPPKIKRTK
ncbi:type II toxin-antitoxin system RelE/ParE family toxin [Dokdonia ponticola]|uniref:Type II toxin-antitoxin system RelE/ParE family toxin n=1 Tax=Dokdonia ponticola TaxID=2041041 RepID=A0ABV9HQE5_9FLAO